MSAASSSSSQIITAAALIAASLGVGYAFGLKSAPTPHPPKPEVSPKIPPQQEIPPHTNDSESDSEEEDDVADGDLSAVKPGFLEPCKLVSAFHVR
ncbi:hypothetical protein PHLCEN_2v12821 [Hermanssonia centrifuga]|uniref:Uncharacterized protein n=1 Tax=Hermanssonia centrifuga TaxID=98765 RepID=A0A2R6NFZ4_9APHY|nr:hypothetical protein PHLCEN_2v12821 [Hermanssonia centrifuga]